MLSGIVRDDWMAQSYDDIIDGVAGTNAYIISLQKTRSKATEAATMLTEAATKRGQDSFGGVSGTVIRMVNHYINGTVSGKKHHLLRPFLASCGKSTCILM